jgi:serine/threonine-protein kinase 24/25/MST4
MDHHGVLCGRFMLGPRESTVPWRVQIGLLERATLTIQMKAGPFKEEYIAILLRELLRGLEYLHGEGKLHRDIKGECYNSVKILGKTMVVTKADTCQLQTFS